MKINHLIIFVILVMGGCSRTNQPPAPVPCQETTASVPDLTEGIEFKSASAVEQRLLKVGTTKELASAIAEVDGWLIARDEEALAQRLIDNAIEKLRVQITAEVTALTKESVSAPKGKEATDKLSEINALLTLYPAPRTKQQQVLLEDLSAHVLATSRRVEDIRRLRYNDWSVVQIQNGMTAYRQKTKGFLNGINPDQDALLKICTEYVRYLDPGFLEPAAMNLYAEFLRRCDAQMDDDRKVKLVRALVDPAMQRHTPSHF